LYFNHGLLNKREVKNPPGSALTMRYLLRRFKDAVGLSIKKRQPWLLVKPTAAFLASAVVALL